MRKWLLLVLLAISAITVGAQQVELGLTPTNNAVKVRLDWQALPGQTYSVGTTTNLVSTNWMETIVAASNVLGAFEVESTNHAQFFRLVKQDTDCPSVISLSPQDRAVAVVSNTTVNISLADETGIDTNSILFDIGPWTGLTLTSPQVTWSSNTITFTPPDILGQAGEIVTNGLTVSDSLGHTLSNYTWTFQLARPTVATNSFLPLTAPANGIQMMSGGSTQLRKIPGIRPLDGTDAYHIVSVTSNTVVFSYSGSLPAVSNGTILVSFDAAYPFYRSIASNTLDETQHQITAWTFDIPLTELVSEGSFSSIHFTPAQQAGSQQLLWGGNLNSLHAEFGDDLSGQVLYESDGLKLWLPPPHGVLMVM